MKFRAIFGAPASQRARRLGQIGKRISAITGEGGSSLHLAREEGLESWFYFSERLALQAESGLQECAPKTLIVY